MTRLEKPEKESIVDSLASVIPSVTTYNNLDTFTSDSTSRPFQLTSRGAIRASQWSEDTVRIGPSKTPNFLAPLELPGLEEEGENPLEMSEEEKDHHNRDLVVKTKVAEDIFEFNS